MLNASDIAAGGESNSRQQWTEKGERRWEQ